MIKEIIKFMELLPEDFKMKGSQPKDGLHIEVRLKLDDNQVYRIDTENIHYEMYSSKKKESSPFLEKCKARQQSAWWINAHKNYDHPEKAIQSCSPFLVAFKREYLKGGDKFIKNDSESKSQIYDRFNSYFEKAFQLFDEDQEFEMYEVFKYFFVRDEFSIVLNQIEAVQEDKRLKLEESIEIKKEEARSTNDKELNIKTQYEIKRLEVQVDKVRELSNSDYILFYLDVPDSLYTQTQDNYLKASLFNTDKFNTEPDDDGLVYGTSDFLNGFNSKMPFLMHQTASFDISGRISNVEAKHLFEFTKVLSNKTLPSPLPLFIYEEELEERMIDIIDENEFKLGYQEVIKKLIETRKEDLSNYYLLFWQNSTKGIVLRDCDFVSKFEFRLKEPLDVINYFEIYDKGSKKLKDYPAITDVFQLERKILKPFIQNKNSNLNYFSDLRKKGYEELDGTYQSYAKYRKTVYDYVYKSQRNLIDEHVFYEMVFNAIKDDLKKKTKKRKQQDTIYNSADKYDMNNAQSLEIKEKLNIWYSTQHIFNRNNKELMGDKLKDYQSFVAELVSDEGTNREATDADFAFTAGMVINYIISKSKAADTSYQLLEPYLQQSRCSEFKKAIANDFARYKHEMFSRRFDRAAAFVLSYDTDSNLKNLLPQILSGVFAKSQLYSK